MKIVLLDNIGKIGIVTEWKQLIDGDMLVFEVKSEGELRIGKHTYKAKEGKCYMPQYHLLLGQKSKIEFIDHKKRVFDCGYISRTGSRLMQIHNDVETCLVNCCAALDELRGEVERLCAENKTLKTQFGISII